MKINVKKTKVMRALIKGGGTVNIWIEGQRVEQVTKYQYLNSFTSEDGSCETEIKARILAKDSFGSRKELLTRKISSSLKKKVVKTFGSDNGKSELDRKEDKPGSTKDCRRREKTCQHDCHQEKEIDWTLTGGGPNERRSLGSYGR